MEIFKTVIVSVALLALGGLICFYTIGILQDAQVTRQLMKPCIDYGYTKAKCRKMIYIPQSEVK